jgi:hypothetical protein
LSETRDLGFNLCLGAIANTDHRDHRRDTDDNPESR